MAHRLADSPAVRAQMAQAFQAGRRRAGMDCLSIMMADLDRLLADNCALDAHHQRRLETLPPAIVPKVSLRLDAMHALVSMLLASEAA